MDDQVKIKVIVEGADEAASKLEALAKAGEDVATAMAAAAESIVKLNRAMAAMNTFEAPEIMISGDENMDEVGKMIDAAMNQDKNDA